MIENTTGGRRLRTAPRHKLFQPTEMSWASGATRVHLLNLSTGGALAHAVEAPLAGTSLRIRCGERVLLARVAWARGPKFGVCFATPMTQHQLDHVLDEQRALITAAASRIGALG